MPLDTKVSKVRHVMLLEELLYRAVVGQTKEQYKGIAQFFAFIAKPETQKRWHEHTGCLSFSFARYLCEYFAK